jgi:hypothetical protein
MTDGGERDELVESLRRWERGESANYAAEDAPGRTGDACTELGRLAQSLAVERIRLEKLLSSRSVTRLDR